MGLLGLLGAGDDSAVIPSADVFAMMPSEPMCAKLLIEWAGDAYARTI